MTEYNEGVGKPLKYYDVAVTFSELSVLNLMNKVS